MSYIEERIKFLAVKCWQNDKSKKIILCPNKDCSDFEWGGLVRAEMAWPSPAHEITTGQRCVLVCHECGQATATVPDEVIDSFLERI